MDIIEARKDMAVLLTLKGRLDSSTSPALEEKIVLLLNAGEKQLAVNFGSLDYISSAGLRVLLMAAKRLKQSNGKIALYALKDHIREVFEIAGFLALFPVYSSEEGALRDITSL
jgi:anti-sigma B factor antagonist